MPMIRANSCETGICIWKLGAYIFALKFLQKKWWKCFEVCSFFAIFAEENDNKVYEETTFNNGNGALHFDRFCPGKTQPTRQDCKSLGKGGQYTSNE